MRLRTIIFVIIIFIITTVVGITCWYYLYQRSNLINRTNIITNTNGSCLSDNEYADYPLDSKYDPLAKEPKIPLTIQIKDKLTNQIKSQFQIDNTIPGQNYLLEIRNCGVYINREFNFDPKKGILPGYSVELWHYRYNGQGVKIMTLLNDNVIQYDFAFRVDPTEKYIELTKGYLGSDNNSVVVLDINSPNLNQVLSVKPKDLLSKIPSLNPNRDMGAVGWSDDGNYLWGASGSETDEAYFRVRVSDKTLEVFKMPDDAVNYGPPNTNTGYIAYVYGPAWGGGDATIQKELSDEWIANGKIATLYIYNLFTKSKITIATSTLPAWNFSENWLSDVELQYKLPSGETKIYVVK